MRIERALAIRDRAKTRLRDVYSSAELGGYTSREISENVASIRGDYPKAPGWVWSYIDGYEQALRDELYRSQLIFGGFVDGVFYSTHSNRDDYYGKHGISALEYSDNGRVTGRGHYWKPEGGAHIANAKPGYSHKRGSVRPYSVNEAPRHG